MLNNLEKYKDDYIREAQEHLDMISQNLLKLEKEPNNLFLLNEVFRHIHTLKSMAAIMHYNETTELCHAAENILSAIKITKLKLPDCIDAIFKTIDLLKSLLFSIQNNTEKPETNSLVVALLNKSTDTIEKVRSINVTVEKFDDLMNLVEEILITTLNLEELEEKIKNPELTIAVNKLQKLTEEIQYKLMQARLVPIGFVFDRFQRMVRDLAKKQDKLIDLQIQGSDVEFDRTIIDEIGESITHLLRNAVDHGIELPAARAQLGKKQQATIKMIATRERNNVVIKIIDDGRGLELEKIKEKAIELGIINKSATSAEVMALIFSEMSTKKQITLISGRGLGLSIVKNKIESLGGTIKATSEPHKGTTFILEIPLTLAIIKAFFVTVGNMLYAIPTTNIESLITIKKTDIINIMGRDTIVLNNKNIPIIRLRSLFNLPPTTSNNEQSIIIINREQEMFGLAVDTFSTFKEIVVKPLNKLVSENKYFTGSTITGSGKVVLILDTTNLLLPNYEKK